MKTTREEAKRAGLKRYFTGEKCKYGHTCERYVCSGHCLECLRNKTAKKAKRKYSEDEAYREKAKNKAKDYAKRNKNKYNEYQSSYRLTNKEKIKIQKSMLRKKNIERYRSYSRNRRAKVRMAPGSHSKSDVMQLLRLRRFMCASCLAKLKDHKYEVDHIVPIALGGSNDKYNLQILCGKCNRAKSTKDPVLWRLENGFLI